MADIRVGTGVSNGTLLGVTTSFPFEYAYQRYVYMMYRLSGSIPAGAIKWYRWGDPTPNTWNYISQCTWNYGGQYYDYIYCACRAGSGRFKVTFAGLSREYTVAAEEPKVTVTVNIKECSTNVPLANAKVALSIGTKLTDSGGKCVFTNVPVGVYISGSVSKYGYETRTIGWNSRVYVTSVTQCIPKIVVPEPKAQIVRECPKTYVTYWDGVGIKKVCVNETAEIPGGTKIECFCTLKNIGGGGNLGFGIKDNVTNAWIVKSGKLFTYAGQLYQKMLSFDLDESYNLEYVGLHYENDTPIIDDSYGYFNLNKKAVCTEEAHEVLEMCPDGVTEKRWRDCINGNWVYDAQTCPECYPEGKYEVLERCPDGVTVKKWRECINGKWDVHIDQCPECYPEGKEIILETCPDGTVKRWKTCINGEWVEDSRECPEAPPAPPCPIMCITMGTPLVDCLGPLRVFRDKVLKRTAPGRWFVSFYYDRLTPVLSPVILKMRRKKNVF